MRTAFNHLVSIFREWLLRSKTCPTCRQATLDNVNYIGRIHLQQVSAGLDSSVYLSSTAEDFKRELLAKDKEIHELRTKLAEHQNTINKIRPYFITCKKSLGHIEVELGQASQDVNDIIDLSSTPPSPAPAPEAIVSNIINRPAAATVRVGAPRLRSNYLQCDRLA